MRAGKAFIKKKKKKLIQLQSGSRMGRLYQQKKEKKKDFEWWVYWHALGISSTAPGSIKCRSLCPPVEKQSFGRQRPFNRRPDHSQGVQRAGISRVDEQINKNAVMDTNVITSLLYVGKKELYTQG